MIALDRIVIKKAIILSVLFLLLLANQLLRKIGNYSTVYLNEIIMFLVLLPKDNLPVNKNQALLKK